MPDPVIGMAVLAAALPAAPALTKVVTVPDPVMSALARPAGAAQGLVASVVEELAVVAVKRFAVAVFVAAVPDTVEAADAVLEEFAWPELAAVVGEA
mmetsp:Transcript_3962/g.6611  ORF Transcript_3962/g.6611 Transcript_3962/m.6611 type:complete len:97 (-) Transcript_3962:510-800(-)